MTIIYMILLIKVLCILYAPMGAFLDGNDLQIVLVIGEYTKVKAIKQQYFTNIQ